MWHGTHHSAQKSIRTGLSDCRTFWSKSWSVTSPMVAIAVPPPQFVEARSRLGSAGAGRRSMFLTPITPKGLGFILVRPSVSLGLQESLRVDGRLAPHPGGGNGLAI